MMHWDGFKYSVQKAGKMSSNPNRYNIIALIGIILHHELLSLHQSKHYYLFRVQDGFNKFRFVQSTVKTHIMLN